MATITKCSGAGTAASDVFEGYGRNASPFINFLLRCDDGPIIRIQLWDTSAIQFGHRFGIQSVKGHRVGFAGRLSGTYDEKPTIVTNLDGLRISERPV